MFRGVTRLTLDSKGRLAIPSKSRDVIVAQAGGRLMATAASHSCILLYPEPEWLVIEERVNSLPSTNPQVEALQDLLIGNARELELDSAGRILVPPELREFVGLAKDVCLVGRGKKFTLWDSEKWNARMDEAISLQQGGLGPQFDISL
ncbi:MAG: division/cell wall cluster transcriptional repressor MraZ [Burkholderiales bacterium]